jgi:hypothetical protein
MEQDLASNKCTRFVDCPAFTPTISIIFTWLHTTKQSSQYPWLPILPTTIPPNSLQRQCTCRNHSTRSSVRHPRKHQSAREITSSLTKMVPLKSMCKVRRWKRARFDTPHTIHATYFLVATLSFHSHYVRPPRSSRIVLCGGPAHLIERPYPRVASVWVTVLTGRE